MSEADSQTRITTLPKNAREALAIDLSTYKGHRLVKARIVVPPPNDQGGNETPTKKAWGVKIEMLRDVIGAFCDAEAEAVRRGWLRARS